MKKIVLGFTLCFVHLLLPIFTAQGADCPGNNWQVIPNYSPGNGGPCQILGLNSREGVCQPGYAFETLCDDISNGRYKTCQGPRHCESPQVIPSSYPYQNDCGRWDYIYNFPCPPGFLNYDCRGHCERQ
jgi:hypothetical protein